MNLHLHLHLPEYVPPHAQRASVAVGVAPIGVLLAFTMIVSGLIDVDTGFAVFLACTVWVVFEMHQFQKSIDGYNEAFVERHLAWRSTATLQELARSPATPPPTREFISRFLDCERVLLRDGQWR
jgi:hypothetical protein